MKTKFLRAKLSDCGSEKDTVVVIDVLRAFTTAAFAFASGAQEIVLTASVEDAFSLRKRFPGILLMGEVEGLPIEGFDLPNSPTVVQGMNLSGKRIVQRTSAGTQGVVGSANADHIFAASLVCARMTALAIRELSPASLTFVETGYFAETHNGDEDAACTDLIISYERQELSDTVEIIRRVRDSKAAQKFLRSNDHFPENDLVLATQIDRFDFAMAVKKADGLLVMQPYRPASP